MKIYALHGVIDNLNSELMGHRNLIDKDKLISFVRINANKIGTIQEVLCGDKEMALTVDDGIYASYECVKAVSEMNIPITWFINPLNIENGTEYSFAFLNSMLDMWEDNLFLLNDSSLKINSFRDKKILRKKIKHFLHLNTETEQQRIDIIKSIAKDNGINKIEIPEYSRSVHVDDIKRLNGDWVSLMNHLYEHNFTDCMSIETLTESMEKADKWLEKNHLPPYRYYALPYGLYSDSLLKIKAKIILLLDNRFEDGLINEVLFNRTALQL